MPHPPRLPEIVYRIVPAGKRSTVRATHTASQEDMTPRFLRIGRVGRRRRTPVRSVAIDGHGRAGSPARLLVGHKVAPQHNFPVANGNGPLSTGERALVIDKEERLSQNVIGAKS